MLDITLSPLEIEAIQDMIDYSQDHFTLDNEDTMILEGLKSKLLNE